MPNCPTCAQKDRELMRARNVREEHEKALLHWRRVFDAAAKEIADLRARLAAAEKRAEAAAADSERLEKHTVWIDPSSDGFDRINVGIACGKRWPETVRATINAARKEQANART